MRVFVTGGFGFIGSHLMRALIARDDVQSIYTMLPLSNYYHGCAPTEFIHPKVNFVGLRPMQFRPGYEENMCDVFFLLGAQTAPQGISSVFDTSLDLLPTGLAGIYKRCFVFASSAAIYDNARVEGDQTRVYGVTEPHYRKVVPQRPGEGERLFSTAPQYAKIKTRNEHVLRVIDFQMGDSVSRWYALRFFNVYGEHDACKAHLRSLPGKIAATVKQGHAFHLKTNKENRICSRDYVDVNRCVQAMIAAAFGPDASQSRVYAPSGVYNVGSGHAVSVSRLISLCNEVAPRPCAVKLEVSDFVDNPAYQWATRADMTKTIEALRLPELSREEALAGLRQYMQKVVTES